MKTILKLLFATLLIYTVAPLFENADMVTSFTVGAIVFAVITALVVPFRYLNTGNLNAVTEMKVWNKYIIEKLRRRADWLVRSMDESKNVLGGVTVYISQAGADPEIEVNTSTFPMVAVQRTDSDVNYNLDRYRTKPSHVAWEELQGAIAYDKIDSVLKGHGNALAEAIADNCLIKWSPTVLAKQINTTGDDIDPVSTQAGNRKGFKPEDLASAMIAMNVANVDKAGRVAIIEDNMYGYFYDKLSQSMMNAFNQFADNKTGQVGRLHGFDIYTRSAVLAYANAGLTANAYGAALAATDNLASICYQEDMVCRAIGETKLFADKDNPLYQGDIFSTIVRAGFRKTRADNNGVIAIVQGQ
jgi:hypothetical protein